MRIRYKDRLFNIQSILPDDRNGIITIMAKEVL
jgi:head-tail adaptor